MIERFVHDVRHAARALRRSPGFAATAILVPCAPPVMPPAAAAGSATSAIVRRRRGTVVKSAMAFESGVTIRPMRTRLLTPSDEDLLETFLAPHRDSSMFIRANVRRAGLAYAGEPFQAIHVGGFRGGRLIGVAAHCWNGMLLLQAPEQAAALARACVERSGRRVTGLCGPVEQVRDARAAVGLAGADAAMDGDEWLFALDLCDLVVPAALEAGTITCRVPRPDERDTLCAWRLAYDIETLGATDGAEQRRRSAEFLDAQIADGHAWVAVDGGAPVSLSAFNAALPDIVQLGGIYTPPELRGRGHARVAVAASLLVARARGASRAILFTRNPSAVRTYQALGFRRVGDYALVLFNVTDGPIEKAAASLQQSPQ
jgi:GNAT superfamily N-acetyltransferase